MTRTESKYVSLLATKKDVAMIAAAVLIMTSTRPEYTSGIPNAAYVIGWHLAYLFWMVYLAVFIVRWVWLRGGESN